jgi:hypothetical protein
LCDGTEKLIDVYYLFNLNREVASRASGELGALPGRQIKLPFGEFRRATMIDFFDRNRTYFVE